MWIGSKYPQIFISPFDHGIEYDSDRPYSYIRALYNTLVCAGSGVLVGLLTTPPLEKNTEGLTVWSLDKAREFFKGSAPNDRPGKTVHVKWVVKDHDSDEVFFSINDMDVMGADEGEMVYLSDERKWLGGLKSIHSYYGKPHREDGVVYISESQSEAGRFDSERHLIADKEL